MIWRNLKMHEQMTVQYVTGNEGFQFIMTTTHEGVTLFWKDYHPMYKQLESERQNEN